MEEEVLEKDVKERGEIYDYTMKTLKLGNLRAIKVRENPRVRLPGHCHKCEEVEMEESL